MQQCILPTAVNNHAGKQHIGNWSWFFTTTASKLYRFSGREKVRLTSRCHGYMIDVLVIHVIYQIQTMPKQKRVSLAHLARQAKKRKRSQREDPVKRQREQERNGEDPVKRQREQERNAAARRQLRINNPERRQEERQHDAATHRQNRQQNLDRRLDEQQRDTIAHRDARENPVRRMDEQQRDTIGMVSLTRLFILA